MSLRWKRLGAGTYEARIGDGDRDRYLVESFEQDPAAGYGGGIQWALTYPGEVRPDSTFDTLREAKAQVAS